MSKPRSLPQHNRLFAVIRAVFHHWPESHKKFQPDSPEHLRAWLLVKSGHRIIKTFHLPEDASNVAALFPVAIMALTGGHSWAWSKGNDLFLCMAESIAFDKLGHNAFCALIDDIYSIIRAETGLDPDQLLKQTEAAA